MKKMPLTVEGWRFISHSYAVVNQWQLLSLLRRGDIDLCVRDVPYFSSQWKPIRGLFDAEQEAALAALPAAAAKTQPAVTLRMSFPYNFTAAQQGRTAVFGTAEYRVIRPYQLATPPDIAKLAQDDDFMVITPSRWSSEGFLRMGLRANQVALVPHGVDTKIFRPESQSREAARRKLRLSGFVFLSVGAMTGNKGMDLLLRAFARVALERSDVTLVLKGADDLYTSKASLRDCFQRLPVHERHAIQERLIYLGDTLSMERMATLYRLADAYVSPYRAEGFNLPVLEAAASGVPVICTGGGATDDFVSDAFAMKIRSKLVHVSLEGDLVGQRLEPDLDHLTSLMFDVMGSTAWRCEAVVAGPRHAASRYDWSIVTRVLTDVLFEGAQHSTSPAVG